MTSARLIAYRTSLFAASSIAALALAVPAAAQGVATSSVSSRATIAGADAAAANVQMIARMVSRFSDQSAVMVEDTPHIITNDAVPNTTPAPGGSLDLTGVNFGFATGVNGIGQMFVRPNPATTGQSLCSGTLINPRTVIFAAHCVNTRPAEAYGPNGVANGLNPNGTPISFGFAADNLPGLRQWLGLASVTGGTDANPALRGATNLNRALFAVEQVWYDPRVLGPQSNGFLEADIALATLDTPAFGIPTWAVLFSPLTGETHATITGYGVNGTHTSAGAPCTAPFTSARCSPLGGIDYRRRAAENMLSSLSSLNDRTAVIFNALGVNPQSLYMMDFDSPAGVFNPAAGIYDFDLYDGAALPREGTTAGGDSGGPLIVDQKFNRPVVVGTLSGGSRFFGPQRFSTYGTSSFYQPLFLFWDAIVANNSYVYAGNLAGDGAWEDDSHWIQLMDPAYQVERNGALVNDLPDTPALGMTGNTVKFGTICFNICVDAANDSEATPFPVGSGTGLVIAGGPGSTGFVPNNISANPKTGVKARYYDVTLTAAGTTTLSSAATIDLLTIKGATKLNVAEAGSLSVLGEFNQWQGWTNIDGLLRVRGDTLIATGLLTGKGTLDPTFLTVAAGIVAPGGGDKVGTLTIQGDVILASLASLFIDVQRGKADRLTVTGDTLNTGILDLTSSPSVVFNKVTDTAAPRFGETYVIASATGGVQGTFGTAYTFQGVLRPELTYTANEVKALMRAGSLVTILDGQNSTAIAFASALDALRGSSYSQLWNLYGAVDWMNGSQLSSTLASLSPRIIGETVSLQDQQSRTLMTTIGSRLSLLGTGRASGLTRIGEPLSAVAGAGVDKDALARRSFALSGGQRVADLPGGLTGFVSGGVETAQNSYGGTGADAGQRSIHAAMGLETPLGSHGTLGTAVGYAEGLSSPSGDRSKTRTTQAAAYASLNLGGGAYVGGVLAAEMSSADLNRFSTDGVSTLRLSGASRSTRYTAMAEAGFREAIGSGLAITPRVQLGYGQYSLDGFSEGGGETALTLDSLDVKRLETRFGAKLDGTATAGGWTISPQVEADYVQLLSGANGGALVRFAAAPDYQFALPLTDGGSSWAEFKGGVRLTRDKLELGANVQQAIGNRAWQDQRASVDLTVRF